MTVNGTDDRCSGYALGHIAGEDFRINTRFMKGEDLGKYDINEANVSNVISEISCDTTGKAALIYYDSFPVAVASIRNYELSVPLGNQNKGSIKIYTVLEPVKEFRPIPSSGYITAVYGFDPDHIEAPATEELDKNDDNRIMDQCSTVFFEAKKQKIKGTDGKNIEVEYKAKKIDLNNDGIVDYAIKADWFSETLPQDVRLTSVFAAINNSDGKGLNRYILFPLTVIRNSQFYLEQVADLNQDGIMEIIIRKNRKERDSFSVFEFDSSKNGYMEIYSDTD